MLPPRSQRDQGIQPQEEPAAARLMASLQRAESTELLATVRGGVFEMHGRDGSLLRWDRWQQPDATIAYRLLEQRGNPVPAGVSAIALPTLASEIAAAGGPMRPLPGGTEPMPDLIRRVSQLFDSPDAPDVALIQTSGADPDDRGRGARAGGAHGTPGIVQSRAPLIIAGPGVRAGATIADPLRGIDVAPTVADLLGIRSHGEDARVGQQYLAGQDGRSRAVDFRAPDAGHAQAERAVMFIIDGSNGNVLADELAAGRLPNIARIAHAGTTDAGGVIAEYPSMTWPNHHTLMTGAEPGHHGIVGNRWYDRESGEVIDTMSGKTSMFRTAEHVSRGVETLPEAVERTWPGARTVAINEPASRGAQIADLELRGIGALLRNAPDIIRRYRAGARDVVDTSRHGNGQYRQGSKIDNIGSSMMSSLVSGATDPKLAVLELMLVDNMGHELGPQHSDTRAALHEADRNIGRVLDALESSGRLASTLLVVTSDHGAEHQTPGPTGLREAIDASGVSVVDADHHLYLRTLRVEAAPTPEGRIIVRVADDDVGVDGDRPAMRDAVVSVVDAAGAVIAQGRTGRAGRAVLDVPAGATMAGAVVRVERAGFTTSERGLGAGYAGVEV